MATNTAATAVSADSGSAADPQCKVQSLFVCDGHDALPVAASRMLVAAHTGRGPALTPSWPTRPSSTSPPATGKTTTTSMLQAMLTAAGLRSLS